MNRRFRLILFFVVLALIAGYAIFAVWIANSRHGEVLCSSIEVNTAANVFDIVFSNEEVAATLAKNGLYYLGKKIGDIDINKMEKTIAGISSVKSANVYSSIDGILRIDIETRTPVLHLYPNLGGSFYMDGDGFVFRSAFVCHVPIVSGNLPAALDGNFEGNISTLSTKGSTDSALQQLCEFGRYIYAHHFWSAQIEQIYFVSPSTIEITPRLGAHVIRFGTLSNYKYKLQKLMTFYREGAPIKGWNTYHSIDVSIGNQVICEKR